MTLLDPILDLFRGRAITIPPMDGAMKPNTALDEAEVVAAAIAPDNLAVLEGRVIYSSHGHIRQLGNDHALLETCPAAVTALAVAGDGTLAIALEDGSLRVGRNVVDGFSGITSLAFHERSLFATIGSQRYSPSQWVHDLMDGGASGSVWKVDIATGQRHMLASALAYANGVVVDTANNRLIVSESWKHRLVSIPLAGGPAREILTRLPAYPGRIHAAPGGFILSLFAPLNRLVEFVLKEPQYRKDMMREIDSRYWIAPSLSPPGSFLEPLQNGSVRSMGIHKPWSPSRSYGLVARLDEHCDLVDSFHSRADGRFHGITSAIATSNGILAASKGGNHIIRISTIDGEG